MVDVMFSGQGVGILVLALLVSAAGYGFTKLVKQIQKNRVEKLNGK